MAMPSGTSTFVTRLAGEQLQFVQQTPQIERETTVPRISMRSGKAPDLETGRSNASILGAISPEGRGATDHRMHKVDVEPAYAAPAVGSDSKAAAIEICDLDEVLLPIHIGEMPGRFSIPDMAKPHLIKFGNTLVSLEKATPSQVALFLNSVINGFTEANKTSTFECVQHLLFLGADVNLTDDQNGFLPAPLSVAVSKNSVPLVSLLLRQGARPDECYEFFYYDGKMKTDVAREMLKAGADPWRSFEQPELIRSDSRLMGLAEYHRQAGLNINAEMSVTFSPNARCTALELAYSKKDFRALKSLLDAGAHFGDPIRVGSDETGELHLTNLFHPATADAIAKYRAQRAFLPCGFTPYTLLHGTLHPGSPNATDTSASSLTTMSMATSGSALAQAALKPACNGLIDGLYSPAAVVRLIASVKNMPPDFAQAIVQALSLARVLGHYGVGKGARAGQLDQGIRVALDGAGLWERYLECKVQFETLQANIDRHQADGRTLLTMAASEGKIRMIRILAKLGARIDFSDKHGDYPLTAAAKARKPDTCSALLTLGANAGTSDLDQRSTLIHVADWLTQTDISDTATIGRIASLIEQLLRLGYDFRQPTPERHAEHDAYPTVVDLLCKPENCVKLALLGQQGTGTLVQAILFNIDQRGSLPFLN